MVVSEITSAIVLSLFVLSVATMCMSVANIKTMTVLAKRTTATTGGGEGEAGKDTLKTWWSNHNRLYLLCYFGVVLLDPICRIRKYALTDDYKYSHFPVQILPFPKFFHHLSNSFSPEPSLKNDTETSGIDKLPILLSWISICDVLVHLEIEMCAL